jgi:transcriptional regulator with XRE-family HTH domain
VDHTGAEWARALAGELRAERARKQMTVAELVTATGLSKSAVLHYLNNQREIPMAALADICHAMGVDVSTIAARVTQALTGGDGPRM